MGHVQRAIEMAGIATVGVYVRSFGHIAGLMGVARALITDHPMGRPLGAPRDTERQYEVVGAALDLLSCDAPTVTQFPLSYRTTGFNP